MGAIGTIAATVVTAIIALTGYLRDVRLRSAAARNAILLAASIASKGLYQVSRFDGFLDTTGSVTAVRYGVKSFLATPAWLEIKEAIAELRPQDLPDHPTAEAYIQVRAILRAIDQLLSSIGNLSATSDGAISWPNIQNYVEPLERELSILKALASRFERPFTPRWLRI